LRCPQDGNSLRIRCDNIGVLGGVDDVVSIGIPAGEIEVTLADPRVEGDVLLLQPIRLMPVIAGLALQAHLGR
jgi:hypothetical protein